jgi:hypothetical protein
MVKSIRVQMLLGKVIEEVLEAVELGVVPRSWSTGKCGT